MSKRSTKLLSFENSLYKYNKENQLWKMNKFSISGINDNIDIFEKGTLSTCKRMSQKINPNLLRKGFLDSWSFTSYLNFKEKSFYKNTFFIKILIETYLESSLKRFQIISDKILIKDINNIFFIKVFCYIPEKVDKYKLKIKKKELKAFSRVFKEIETGDHLPFIISKGQQKRSKSYSSTIDLNSLIKHFELCIYKFCKKEVKIVIAQRMSISDSASSIAKFLSYQIEESKVNFKKALRDTLKEIDKKSNIRGIRINCSGRLGKNPMAKTEWFKYGQVPLNQINTNLEYATAKSSTKYGSIGIKVWVYYHI